VASITTGAAPLEDARDLGFGGRVAERTRARLLNRDGTFNVHRHGLPVLHSLSLYQALVTMSWARFYAVVVGFYVLLNLAFAYGYLLCGPGALHGSAAAEVGGPFMEAFFFSVQTLATIGYGRVSPTGLAANLLVCVEALVGLLGLAFATSLSFARFSRPSAQVLFSQNALIAPYREGTGFEFRIVNERKSQLIQVELQVIFSRRMGSGQRRFDTLRLERSAVVFFPLHWTVVHPIDAQSPLSGLGKDDLVAGDAEFLVLLTAIDETFSQTVHARSSYRAEEVVVGARFRDVLEQGPDGRIAVDLRRFHGFDPAPLPPPRG
jgi:inward rectifier potassium channel